MTGGTGRVTVGVAAVVLALVGWIATVLAAPLLQQPGSTEDLTAAWRGAGPTPLGRATTVAVPPGQTLVAFLVGTDLYGVAGTTTGTCTATGDGHDLELNRQVQINRSLTDVLTEGQQTVAVAGWPNRTNATVSVTIRCQTSDSTVEHYVAVPTRTAVLTRDPWFQPWGWVALAGLGVGLIAAGARPVNPPSP